MISETELQRVAEEYRREGYEVVVRPEGLDVELHARRGRQNVAVQIRKNQFAVADDSGLIQRADAINARPDWRYDLVVLEENPPFRDPLEPDDEQFNELIRQVRKAEQTGLNEMAITFACASLEAALRKARNGEAAGVRWTSTELLNSSYSNGWITPQEFESARQGWELRNRAVHGLMLPSVQPSLVGEILAVAQKLRSLPAA
jgi:hypothetical protein